ncbi:MAG: rRNA maturation RNase YbeY [Spirochaetota bacterium]|jgi:probable rRNA maturation factor|nr:rRNA maturation RNase YbeY [Spirochaetota bacterium]
MEEFYIEYDNDAYAVDLPQDKLQEWISSVLKEVERDGFSLSLLFTDDEKIQELNRDFRGKDMATDVLSFSQMEGEEFGFENHFLGDIVIAVPYVTKQAQGLGHSVFEEVRYLILHGILHLMGYDHDENEDCEMSRLEKSIYKKLTGETVE